MLVAPCPWVVDGTPAVFAEDKAIAHYVSLRETWASVPLDRARKSHSPEHGVRHNSQMEVGTETGQARRCFVSLLLFAFFIIFDYMDTVQSKQGARVMQSVIHFSKHTMTEMYSSAH
jgi:hypothetical protein